MRTPLVRMLPNVIGAPVQGIRFRFSSRVLRTRIGGNSYFAQTTTREPSVVSGLIPQDTV